MRRKQKMEPQNRFWSRLGILGVAYGLLFVAANVLIGNGPSTNASGTAVVTYYRAHKASEIAGIFVVAFALVAFTFFLASLRKALSRTEEGRQLSGIVTAGGAIYAVGILIMTALTSAMVDAGRYHLAGAAQTLNVLNADAWVPVVVGISVVALGTGVSALRNATLPKWVGWVSVILGVLALAGPAGAIAFLVTPLWALVVGIVLFRSPARVERLATQAVASYSPANS
jgi:succinate dehydrogenase/fumarate reductase cytochrome b subunit